MDRVCGAWGALFAAAGLNEATDYEIPGQIWTGQRGQYRNGVKKVYRSSLYTRHDMRRGFNRAARLAGMDIEDRCALLGHSVKVNEVHYDGHHEVNLGGVKGILEEIGKAPIGKKSG